MTITTKDGIAVQLEIGQVFTTPEECDLIGRTFSDGRKTGVVKTVEFTYGWVHGLLEPRLWFGQNYINIWQAFQACEVCHASMEWYEISHYPMNGEPPYVTERYMCEYCEHEGEQAQGNVINGYELPI